MVTDWLHNPQAAFIAPLAMATVCAFVLAVTQRFWSSRTPRGRTGRAFLIVACYGLGWYLAMLLGAGQSMMWAATNYPALFSYSSTFILLLVLINGFFGWVLPLVSEGRTLDEIGWKRHHLWAYGLVAGVVAIVFRLLLHHTPAGEDFVRELAPGLDRSPLAFLKLLPPWFFGVCLLQGLLVGCAEENLFRGHLMISLREKGLSGARANVVQALAFAAVHPYAVLFWTDTNRGDSIPGVYFALFLFGLLFGFLRWRTGSIVPGVVFHAVGNAVWNVIFFGLLVTLWNVLYR